MTHDLGKEFLHQLQQKAADPEIRAAGIRNLFKLSTSLMSIMILADDLQHYEDIDSAHRAVEHKLEPTRAEAAAAGIRAE